MSERLLQYRLECIQAAADNGDGSWSLETVRELLDHIEAVEAERERFASALRIIQTWAACDNISRQPRVVAMSDIESKAKEALKR